MPRQLLALFLLMASVALTGCRVVVLKFDPEADASDVNRVQVDGRDPDKGPIVLGSVRETVGYRGVSKHTIEVAVSACAGSELRFTGGGVLEIDDNDEVIVRLALVDAPAPCPIPGSNTIIPDGGTGGTGNAGGEGGQGGGGAGGTDAGTGPDGCDDDGATHCEDPAATPEAAVPPTLTITPVGACDTYCEAMMGPENLCPGIYADIQQCKDYCALAWSRPGDDRLDTLSCRTSFIVMARMPGGQRAALCEGAGPSGAAQCGGACFVFCSALHRLCPGKSPDCVSACNAARGRLPAEPGCRFRLLPRAISDARYCDYVDFSSGCVTCSP